MNGNGLRLQGQSMQASVPNEGADHEPAEPEQRMWLPACGVRLRQAERLQLRRELQVREQVPL
jgi:hypothetical protein